MRVLSYRVLVTPSSIIAEPLKVLYEDNHLIAVFKPHRMLVQGDQTGDESLLEIVKKWLKKQYSKPGNVYVGLLHRLDRPVAGLVLFAKTSKAASRISEQIRKRSFGKTYRAIVEGIPQQTTAELKQYLSFDSSLARAQVWESPAENRQLSHLAYRVLGSRDGLSLLDIELYTGRKHQIRAQLADCKLPILGDKKYGSVKSYSDFEIALIAHSLDFKAVTSDETISIELRPSDYPHPEIWKGFK